jgi:hypothetical protein
MAQQPYGFLFEHPSFDYATNIFKPCFSYLVDALTSTIPDVIVASSLVSADAFKASIGNPNTLSYEEAMADKELVDQWREAVRKEIATLEAHGT